MGLSSFPQRIGIVGIYPPPNTRHGGRGGAASYAHNLAIALRQKVAEVVVLSDCQGDTEGEYTEHGVRVIQCWTPGPKYPFQIARQVRKQRLPLIHIQHEFFMYGGAIPALLFPFLVLLCRIAGARVLVTLHGVVPLNLVTRQFVEENQFDLPPTLVRWGFWALTWLTAATAHGVVVHEPGFKVSLQHEYKVSPGKVTVIPHGVEQDRVMPPKHVARQRCGVPADAKVVLFFGYLSPYKGLDVLLEAFLRLQAALPDAYLLVAGGVNSRMANRAKFQEYSRKLQGLATRCPDRITFMGFAPEDMIPDLYGAADVLVLPYRVTMASSGPLTLAMAFGRAVLVSDRLHPLFPVASASASLVPEDLASRLQELLTHPDSLAEIESALRSMAESRHWPSIAAETVTTYRRIASV